MTVLRAQASTNKASSTSQGSTTDRLKLSHQPRGRKTHSLVRGSCQRDLQALESARFNHSLDKRRGKKPLSEQANLVQDKETQGKERQEQASWIPVVAVTALPLLVGAPALAAYSPAQGEQVLKNAAGAAYVILVCFFFYRLLRKRAYTGVTQNFRSKANEALEDPDEEIDVPSEAKEATPLTALWGAFQAGVICYLLFQVCGLIDGYFDRQEMPDQYTAHNITVTLRTVIRGLAYLMTFLFGANCAGLSGKLIQEWLRFKTKAQMKQR